MVPDWTCVALKTKSCSGLDLRIVHVWELFDWWMVPAWSLKNLELFRIGLAKSPKIGEVFKIELNIFLKFV